MCVCGSLPAQAYIHKGSESLKSGKSRVWMSAPVCQEEHTVFVSLWDTLSHSSPTISPSHTHTHTHSSWWHHCENQYVFTGERGWGMESQGAAWLMARGGMCRSGSDGDIPLQGGSCMLIITYTQNTVTTFTHFSPLHPEGSWRAFFSGWRGQHTSMSWWLMPIIVIHGRDLKLTYGFSLQDDMMDYLTTLKHISMYRAVLLLI